MSMSAASSGSFSNLESFLRRMKSGNVYSALQRFGQEGVNALAAATPVDEGETARSWYYEIVSDANSWSIIWGNSHVEGGRPIAVLLQTGHATGDGGYVQGRDYINPALQPVFDRISAEAWKAVTS